MLKKVYEVLLEITADWKEGIWCSVVFDHHPLQNEVLELVKLALKRDNIIDETKDIEYRIEQIIEATLH